MSRIYPVNFCGGETAGSAAHSSLNNCPTCGAEVNFKGRTAMGYHHGLTSNVDCSKPKKNNTALKLIIGVSAAAIATVAGLGKGYEPLVAKLKDGKIKNMVKKAEPAAAKCKEWCNVVQTKSVEYWDKIKNCFNKKG